MNLYKIGISLLYIKKKKKKNKTKQKLCKLLKITTCLGFTALYFLLFLGKKKKNIPYRKGLILMDIAVVFSNLLVL